jgi:hypothetical protein
MGFLGVDGPNIAFKPRERSEPVGRKKVGKVASEVDGAGGIGYR